jgi:hypothetical protein
MARGKQASMRSVDPVDSTADAATGREAYDVVADAEAHLEPSGNSRPISPLSVPSSSSRRMQRKTSITIPSPMPAGWR